MKSSAATALPPRKTPQMLFKVCAWHEAGQGYLPLPGFLITHGICPVCATLYMINAGINTSKYNPMKHDETNWPQMLRDGGWVSRPSSGYWPVYRRESRDGLNCMEIAHNGNDWTLFIDTVYCESGTLTECLEESILLDEP